MGGLLSREVQGVVKEVEGSAAALLPLVWTLARGDSVVALGIVSETLRRLGHMLKDDSEVAELAGMQGPLPSEFTARGGQIAAVLHEAMPAGDEPGAVVTLGLSGLVLASLARATAPAMDTRNPWERSSAVRPEGTR